MLKKLLIFVLITSLFVVAGCTVGEKKSENNTNNTNNVNNNNTNNNTNNYSPEHPSSLLKGFWRITEVDTIRDTADGSVLTVITPTGTTITAPDSSTYVEKVLGHMYFDAVDDNTVNSSFLILFAKDNFLTAINPAIAEIGAQATLDGSDVIVTFDTEEGEDPVVYTVTRTDTLLTLDYIATEDATPSPDIFQKIVLAYVGPSPENLVSSASIDNMTLIDTDDSSVLLTSDSWAYMQDGYYYQIKSTWTSDNFGIFTWDYNWDYSVSETGDPVEGTKSYSRKGYMWNDNSGNVTFFFTDFEDSSTRFITLNASVTTGDATDSFVFSVQDCFDSEDDSCQTWNPTGFTFIAQ